MQINMELTSFGHPIQNENNIYKSITKQRQIEIKSKNDCDPFQHLFDAGKLLFLSWFWEKFHNTLYNIDQN